MKKLWNFDQAEDVAAITTRQVLKEKAPVLKVVHYDDDHSWAFTCGTTDDPADGLVVAMGCIVELDPTLHDISDLEPGYGRTIHSMSCMVLHPNLGAEQNTT